MKCPYREFQECIVEKCPACNYKEDTKTIIRGRAPYWMSYDEAITQGYIWEETVRAYKFISCKLIDSNVQPIPATKQIINNTTNTNVAIKKSIF